MPYFVPPRLQRWAAGDSQERLLARLGDGDSRALELLYRREADPVYRFVLALCGNASWAADATQDAFLALAARPAGFDPSRGSLGAYLAGAARHALLAQWRAVSRWEPQGADDEVEEADFEARTPETLLVERQSAAAVAAALRSLPWTQREAVVLVDLQERDYAEAARIAGIPLNTLRTRLHRGRCRLATLLGGGPGGSP